MASRAEVAFSWIIPIVCSLFLCDTFLYNLVNFNILPFEYLLLKVTHIMMLFTTIVVFYVALRYRKVISEIICFSNKTSLDILHMDNGSPFRLMRNRVYLGLKVFHFCIYSVITLGLLQCALEPLWYGKLFFGTFSPFNVVPFPVEALAEFLILGCLLLYGSTFVVFFFEPILILAISFHVIAEELQGLRSNKKLTGKEDIDQFKAILRKHGGMRTCVGVFHSLCKPIIGAFLL